MKTNDLTFTKVNPEKRYHMIDLAGKRMGNYEIRDLVLAKWEHSNKSENGNGNVNYDCSFDLSEGRVVWGEHNFAKILGLANIISSPLLLYRLISIFHGNTTVVKDPYKTIWWYNIKHKETGRILVFGEWKGAAGFWLPESSHAELKQPFKSDLEELLLFLISDQIPHPYDGCTSGQIA